jgi:NAD(P)-dependent dehydrogenase (short-subunit alcohol dehydrogenase family)
MTDHPMSGRVVLITGAAGGLGRAHAHAFGALGAHVVLSDVSDPAVVVAEVTAAGGSALGVVAGVDTWEGAAVPVAAAVDAFGRLDVLVNNAGIIRDKSFAKATPEMIEAVLAVHLHGAFHMTKAAWPHLSERGGSIINTTSGSGLYGNFGQVNYAAAKAGLVGFTRALALEGARAGIRVNAIAPLAKSAMTETMMAPELLERLAPEWVSPLVTWLASDGCTATGCVYSVGAGRYARVATLEAQGVRFEHVPTIAELADAAAAIDDLAGAVEPASLADQIALVAPPA